MVNGQVLYQALLNYVDRLIDGAPASRLSPAGPSIAQEVRSALSIASDVRFLYKVEGGWRNYEVPEVPAEPGSVLSIVRAALDNWR